MNPGTRRKTFSTVAHTGVTADEAAAQAQAQEAPAPPIAAVPQTQEPPVSPADSAPTAPEPPPAGEERPAAPARRQKAAQAVAPDGVTKLLLRGVGVQALMFASTLREQQARSAELGESVTYALDQGVPAAEVVLQLTKSGVTPQDLPDDLAKRLK